MCVVLALTLARESEKVDNLARIRLQLPMRAAMM